VAVRRCIHHPLPAFRPTPQTRHVRFGSCLVHKHEPIEFEASRLFLPGLATGGYLCAVLLARVDRLFF